MNGLILREGEGFAHDPSRRGYHSIYRIDETNRCPGCGRSQWYLGRSSAECGFCATAVPLSAPVSAVDRLAWF